MEHMRAWNKSANVEREATKASNYSVLHLSISTGALRMIMPLYAHFREQDAIL